jgi:SSS family solute:Na+ symporter
VTQFDFSIALIFASVVFVLGLSFSKGGTSVKSFFAAGGAVPWWISGLSLFMSFFSVGTFVVWGSIAYKSGLVAVTIQTTMSLAGFLVGYFIAPKWNKTNALTAAEFITHRLGTSAQKFYTLIFLFISLFSGGAFLYPVGKMIEVTTGLPLTPAIVLLGVFIIAYTSAGGLWAVLVTDVLQFVVLMAAVVIIVPLAFSEIGGTEKFVQQAPENFFNLTNSEYDWLFMAAFGFYNMVFVGGGWAYVQRYTCVKNPKDAKKVGYLFGALYLIAPMVWMLPPMIYRIISPDTATTDAEGAYLMVSQLVVPDGLMGLILGAMVFATASSVNTTLNISAGVFTNDIYKLIKKTASEKETMLVARLSTIVFGILSILVALSVTSMGGIVEVAFSLAAITGVALFLPPLWAMYSDRQTGLSVVLTSLVSLLINGFFKFFSPSIFDFSLSRSLEMLSGVVIPVVCLLAREVYARLNPSIEKTNLPSIAASPVQETLEVDADPEQHSDNTHGRKVIALGVVAIGVIISFLGVQADKGQNSILIVGAAVLLLSVFIFPKKTNPLKKAVSK